MDAGLFPACERSVAHGGRFPGVAGCDARLLKGWLGRVRADLRRLWTNVPCGPLPEVYREDCPAWMEKDFRALWCRRVDCLAVVGDELVLVELKPCADHHALGQVLCYDYWLRTLSPAVVCDRLLVVTDFLLDGLREPYLMYGVEAVELGDFDPPLRAWRDHVDGGGGV